MAVFNYPFDFAFFAHVTPGRCPTEKVPEIFIPLPVAEVVVYFRMAGLTKAHEVVPCVSAAFGNGQNVVNFLYRSQSTFLETLFAQRMLCGVAVTDAFPCSAVPTADSRVSVILLVPFVLKPCVFFTEPTIG